MRKKRIIKRVFFVISLFLVSAGMIHAMVFPQETRCIFVDVYDFERNGSLYYRNNVSSETISQLKEIIEAAEIRVSQFWGEKTVEPKFIYCQDDEDYKKFGVPFMTPACANMKLGSYIVISKTGIDLNIISHEISHTELFNRIGFFNRVRKIPIWFDEGLAMQVDLRDYYSVDSLKAKSDGFKNLPKIEKMTSYKQFGSGTNKEVMLNYSTAKYVVNNWHSNKKLIQFINGINNGKSFDEAYKK